MSESKFAHIVTEEEKVRRKAKLKETNDKKFQVFLDGISKNDLFQYYEIENHNQTETCDHFKISSSILIRLLKHYNIVKSVESHNKLIKQSKLEKYGDSNYNNRDKAKKTYIEKYGVDNPFKDTEKIKQSYIDKLGVDHPMRDKEICNKVISQIDYQECKEKREKTNLEKYGYKNPFENPDLINRLVSQRKSNGPYINQEHTIETCMKKYGVAYPCMTPQARIASSSESKPNKEFALLLDDINFEREFALEKYSFDFKIENNLIEINPTATHNSNWSAFGNGNGLAKDYHFNKSKTASENGYRCIHIFDWDDKNKIINILKDRPRVYARKCEIKEVNQNEAIEYINKYHLQGYAKDSIRIGLYYNNELVQIMTFGKPRYNKNYEYELIRLCGHYQIVGGAEKLFKYFTSTYNPTSIISYCDYSKFRGDVYTKLGFTYKSISIGKHWYNLSTGQHITDNLLRQRGFDQLFKTNYGKGTSNEQLMLENGFVEIYDAGQAVYIWKK